MRKKRRRGPLSLSPLQNQRDQQHPERDEETKEEEQMTRDSTQEKETMRENAGVSVKERSKSERVKERRIGDDRVRE